MGNEGFLWEDCAGLILMMQHRIRLQGFKASRLQGFPSEDCGRGKLLFSFHAQGFPSLSVRGSLEALKP
jgi:hypothetical protein